MVVPEFDALWASEHSTDESPEEVEVLLVQGASNTTTKNEGKRMLNNAIVFLVIALIAAFLGFGMVAGVAATIAKICFVVFLILFVLSLFKGRGRARTDL